MTKTPLKLSDEKARELYKSSNPEWKTVLEDSYGKEFFSQKITDRIKTFNDCLAETKSPFKTEQEFISFWESKGLDIDDIGYKMAKIVTKALIQDWVADWDNNNQPKYYPWFDMRAGFGFSLTSYVCWNSGTDAASRLCFPSSELAKYAGTQFNYIFKNYIK